MIIGINQPYYLPYIGLFDRIKMCDLFVINTFSKLNREKSPHRRVKIIQLHPEAATDSIYLTQYVEKKDDRKPFCDIQLSNNFWERQNTHAKHIYHTYRSAKHFNYIEDILDMLIDRSSSNLGDFNYRLTRELASKFGLQEKLINIAETSYVFDPILINSSTNANNENFAICRYFSADTMIVGHNGYKWVDLEFFAEHNIGIISQKINLVAYPQYSRSQNFVKGLSVVDLLANCGEDAKHYLGENSHCVRLQ